MFKKSKSKQSLSKSRKKSIAMVSSLLFTPTRNHFHYFTSLDDDSLSQSDDQEQMIALNPNDDHLITADWSRSNSDDNDVSDFPSSAPEETIETSPVISNNNYRKRPQTNCEYNAQMCSSFVDELLCNSYEEWIKKDCKRKKSKHHQQ